jgi:hypothetical protein
MRAKNKLSEMTLEQLHEHKNKMKGVLVGLGIVMLVAESVLLYVLFTTKGSGHLAIIALSTFICFIPAIINYSQIDKEIKSRQGDSGKINQ